MPRADQALNDDQREFVLRLIAEHRGPAFVCRAFAKEFGRSLARSTVCGYKKSLKHAPTIERFRQQLRYEIRERIPIASKYWRLQALQDLYRTENRYRVVRYTKGLDAHGRETQVPIFEKPLGELRAILQLAAQEMGDLREVVEHTVKETDEYVAEFSDGVGYGENADAPPSAAPDVSTETIN